MIVVKLQGGLGNQMFQYAFARSLSFKKNTPFYLDTSFFENQQETTNFTPRSFELNVFNINISIASKDQIDHFSSNTIANRIKKNLGLRHYKVYHETSFCYNPNVMKVKPPTYYDGYWQCEKYFLEYRPQILKEFVPANKLDQRNQQTLQEIRNTNSVSIHVRRGDFIKSVENLNFHGVCSIEYYQNAIELLMQKQQNVQFFLFTEDPDWLVNTLPTANNITTIKGNTGKNSWKDLYLMKECRHNIIANSSFSWWGAWLNINPNKTVIAPQRWFATTDPFWNFRDIIPSDWLKMDNG
jgi:hypothetical protein